MRPIIITVGPAAATPARVMARMDDWAHPSISIQCVVTGTVDYTVQTSNDDPNDPGAPVAAGSMAWSNSPDSAVVGATATKMSKLDFVPRFVAVLLNSGTGSVTATILQAGVTNL